MSFAGRTPWDVLGLPENAPFSDVKKAYFRRARTTHPDAVGGRTEAFREVQAAYDALRRRDQAEPASTSRSTNPSPYDRWTAGTRAARQWVDEDPWVVVHRMPSFAEVLAREVGRQPRRAA